VYQKFLLGMMLGESFALEVDSNDDIDNFLAPTDISRSRVVALHKE